MYRDFRSFGNKQFCCLLTIFLHGRIKRCLSILILGFYVCAFGQKQFSHILVCRQMQRCDTVLVLRIHIGAFLKNAAYSINIPQTNSCMYRYLRALGNEQFHDVPVVRVNGNIKWHETFTVFSIDISTLGDEQVNDILVAVSACVVQWCGERRIPRIDVSTMNQKELSCLFVAA